MISNARCMAWLTSSIRGRKHKIRETWVAVMFIEKTMNFVRRGIHGKSSSNTIRRNRKFRSKINHELKSGFEFSSPNTSWPIDQKPNVHLLHLTNCTKQTQCFIGNLRKNKQYETVLLQALLLGQNHRQRFRQAFKICQPMVYVKLDVDVTDLILHCCLLIQRLISAKQL